jgi:hypothetical protein
VLDEEVKAHIDADALAQRYLGNFEPWPGCTPDEYHDALKEATRAFRVAHPEWKPEKFNHLGFIG